jgi:phosphoribosyl 1,2-cyclic phosphodiesterase
MVRYGGNTSCVEVALEDGSSLVLDAGTGIRALGVDLVARRTRRIHLFLTHLHLDHLEGLRFFAPLWDDAVTLDLWGPRSPVLGLRDRIRGAFSPPLFPLDFRDVPASITFHDLPGEEWHGDGVTLDAALVLHPGPTLGFRIETPHSRLAYLPDHEPALAGIHGRPIEWLSAGGLASDADVVLHDAQYSEEEYIEHIGWGHSSAADAVAFCRAVRARQLVLFHHDPGRTDHALELHHARAQELAEHNAFPVVLAHEGMTLELH